MTVLWNVRDVRPGRDGRSDGAALHHDRRRTDQGHRRRGRRPSAGARDLGGATALPGLIDAHCHVLSDTSRSPGFGPPPARHGEPPRPAGLGHYILAATADRMLRSGFTTVRDVGCYDDESTVLKLAIETGIVPGPRILDLRADRVRDVARGRHLRLDVPPGRRAVGHAQGRPGTDPTRGADFIKFMATGARSVVLEDPEPPQMTLEEMQSRSSTRRTGWGGGWRPMPRDSQGTRLAMQAGVDTIEHGLALHREPRLLDIMAERGTVLVPTLSTFHDLAERFVDDFAPVLVEQAKRQLDEAMRTVDTARRAGVTMALGYDSGPPGTSARELLRLVGAGLSSAEAIRAATIGGAAALGREDLGRIDVGCRADVVLVDGRPDEDPTLLTQPEAIILVVGRGVMVACRSVVQDERDQHVHPIADDPAVLDIDGLFLDPGALDVAKRPVGAIDALVDGILEAALGTGADLGHARDGHGRSPPGGDAGRRPASLGAPIRRAGISGIDAATRTSRPRASPARIPSSAPPACRA